MYRLKEIGKIQTKKASEISSSRLGIGFEKLDRAVSFKCADLGDVSLVDPLDGTIYEIPPEIMQRDEFGNIKLSLLPIKDYPLILIFGGL